MNTSKRNSALQRYVHRSAKKIAKHGLTGLPTPQGGRTKAQFDRAAGGNPETVQRGKFVKNKRG